VSTVLLDRHRQSSYYIPVEPREHQETVAPAECMHSVTNFWEPVVIAACHAGRHARYRHRGLLGCAFVISAAARRLGIAKPGTGIQLSVEFGYANFIDSSDRRSPLSCSCATCSSYKPPRSHYRTTTAGLPTRCRTIASSQIAG